MCLYYVMHVLRTRQRFDVLAFDSAMRFDRIEKIVKALQSQVIRVLTSRVVHAPRHHTYTVCFCSRSLPVCSGQNIAFA